MLAPKKLLDLGRFVMVNPLSNVIHVTQNSHLASVVAGSEKAKYDLQALANSEKTKADLDRIAKMEKVEKSETIDPEREHEREKGEEQSHYTEEVEKMLKKRNGKDLTEDDIQKLKEDSDDGEIPHLLDVTA
jgi:hypothetical protein